MTARSVQCELTPLQALFWAGHQIYGETPLYNMAHLFTLRGQVDPLLFQRAFQHVINESDALRTLFFEQDGRVCQRVESKFPFGVAVIDFSGEQDTEAAVRAWAHERARRRLDLGRCSIDCALLLAEPGKQFWFLNQHHIICDAWSTSLVFQRFAEAYAALASGLQSDGPQSPSFLEYVASLPPPDTSREEYWRDRLQDALQPLSFYGLRGKALPARHVRTACDLGEDRSQRLRTLASRNNVFRKTANVSLFNVMASILMVFLHRVTGERRHAVGMPYHNRETDAQKRTAGLFIDVLPLPCDIVSQESFLALVRRVGDAAVESVTNRPFAGLPGIGTQPFDVLFNFQIAQFATFNDQPVEQEWIHPGYGTERFVFQVHDFTQTGALSLYLDFDEDLFDEALRARATQHMLHLIDAVLANPEAPLATLNVLDADEVAQLLDSFNNTARALPEPATIPRLFESIVGRTPEATAVSYGDACLDYRSLNQRANRLAHLLQSEGIGPDVPVGLCMDRSADLVAAMLGILKAGGAYVPLDSTYPEHRIALMMADAGFPILVTQRSLLDRMPPFSGRTLCVEDVLDDPALPGTNPSCPAEPQHLAYIMYTSGSTGTPKGVMVPHRAIVRLVLQTDYVDLCPDDRIAQASNASFDAATFEIWGALLNGAQLVGVSQETALSPHGLSDFLRAESISTLFLTTALFNQIALAHPDAFASLRYLLFGGEACDPRCVRRVLEGAPPRNLLHVYGPTENTTFSTWYRVEIVPEGAVTIPIGRPIANTQCYVLSEDLQPAPIGVTGELYLGGFGLARGYFKRPDLTAEAFVADPFHEGEVLYRTGDLVRRLDDGAFEFVGRKDGQIKLRGFRIELGEIEAALNGIPAVRESTVTLREDQPGDKYIAAHIVPDQAERPEPQQLRTLLAETLPDYMIPRTFVFMDALPLTPNGKVDKRALPAPGNDTSESPLIAPRTPLEADIARLWSDTLGRKAIGVTERFFDVGGHSLLAVRIMATIRDRYEVDFPLTRFFQDPTVAGMAAYIQQEQGGGAADQASGQTPFTLVPIQPRGERRPLFCVATAGGVLFPYFNLAPLLGTNQPLFGLQDPALEGNRPPFDTVEELAAHYIGVMRNQQPSGPYLLCGWSYGGTVAFEMGRQLREQGHEVALLVIIDAMQAPPDLSVRGGIGAFLRVWLRRARIFILNTYHLRPYIVDGLYLVFRRGRTNQKAGEIAVGDYFRWACTDVVLKHAGIANVVSHDSLLMMKVPAFRRIFKVLHANGEAWKKYLTKPYDGRLTVFRAEVQPPELVGNDTLGWGEVALKGVDVHVIPGYHSEILGVGIPHCAEHLMRCLDETQNGQHAGSPDALPTGTAETLTSSR